MALTSGSADTYRGLTSETTSGVMQGVLKERDKVFTRPGDVVRKKDGLVEELVRSAAAGFGVISEALHHRRAKKSKPPEQADLIQQTKLAEEAIPDGSNGVISCQIYEEQEVTAQKPESKPLKDSGDLAMAFVSRNSHHEIRSLEDREKLVLPVILPQRRPEKRARGFIRAYAPVLANVDIDQDLFLDFIDTFNKALEPNPWINALNLAGFAGSAMPEPASMLFGFGVEYMTEAALEGHSRYSSNTFLDRVNTHFFNPRGLMCGVVTWQPDIGDKQLDVNFEGVVTSSRSEPRISERISRIATQETSAKEEWQCMKDQMGEMMKLSNGNFKWPEAAPLVIPAEINVAESGNGTDAKKKNALDRMEVWMDNVSDKRAQAKWIDENTNKPAANLMPTPEFRSRYADPNHPAASGDIVALVTGGRWVYADKKSTKKSKNNDDPRKKEDGKESEKNKEDNKQSKKDSKSKKSKSDDMNTSTKKSDDWLKSLFEKVQNIPRLKILCC
ncbi:hypothetical protein EsH8_II_001082 [Colletotrichum jinshuiense]